MFIVNYLKKNFIVLLTVIGILFIYLLFIYRATADVPVSDQFRWFPFVDDYFQGNLSLESIWNTERRSLVGILIFIFNAKYFDLNTMLERYAGGFVLFSSALLLFSGYRHTLSGKLKNVWIQLSFALIALIIFSLSKSTFITFSIGLKNFLTLFSYLVTLVLFDKYLLKRNLKVFYGLLVSLIFSVLVFCSAYIAALVGAMLITLLIDFFIGKGWDKRYLIQVFGLFLFSGFLLFIFLYGSGDTFGGDIMAKESFIEIAKAAFANFFDAVKFVLYTFSASVLTGEHFKSLLGVWFLVLGGVVVFIYGFSFTAFFLSKMYKKSYLPFILLCFAIFIVGSVLLGRFDFGVSYGTAGRYTLGTHYGSMAIVWISIYFLVNKGVKGRIFSFLKMIACLILVIVFVGQIYTNNRVWKQAPFIQNTQNKKIENYLTKDEDKFSKRILEGLEILEKYNLNMFNSER